MRLYNSGEGTVTTSVGRLEPKKYLDVPEPEAKRLLGMYSSLKDAKKMIGISDEPQNDVSVTEIGSKQVETDTTEEKAPAIHTRLKKAVKHKKR